MTLRHQIETETISFVIVAILLGSYLAWHNTKTFEDHFRLSTPFLAENAKQKVIAPLINPVIQVDTASQVSPDGTKKLIMNVVDNTNKTLTYTFAVIDVLSKNENKIYTTTLNSPEKMNIPFNTWSPDNQYVFIQKNNNQAMVFSKSGEPVNKDLQYFDVTTVFKEKIKADIFDEVTGWASPTLLLVNTVTKDGAKGTSYWFEIPSQAVIPLATQF